jgi:hypothetical protein
MKRDNPEKEKQPVRKLGNWRMGDKIKNRDCTSSRRKYCFVLVEKGRSKKEGREGVIVRIITQPAYERWNAP